MKETKNWINEIREEIDEANGLQIEGSESIVEPQFEGQLQQFCVAK